MTLNNEQMMLMLQLLRTGYIVAGIYLALLGILTILRGSGLLEKEWYRYLVPSIGLLASLISLGFLFARGNTDLSQIWYVGGTNPQLRPHLLISVILGVASITAFFGLAVRITWFDVATVVALLALGIVFFTQLHQGTIGLTLKISRIVGISLILSVLIHVGAAFVSKWYKLFTVLTGMIFLFCAALLVFS